MSDSLASVTLLAVANGAGDVITALVASGTATGISYNIGSLYGAGLFCASFIISATIK
jgi:sodium/potassium/calcium exchanger 6